MPVACSKAGRGWIALDCLKLVAKVDLGSQNLEENDDLLVWKLTILCDEGQDWYRR